MNNDFINKLAEIRARIPDMIKRLPGIAKVEGLRFIADNFAKEGFETKTGSYDSWKKKKKQEGKKTLMGNKRGGSLKRSWQQESKATGETVEFTSSLPYAAVHNEGLQAGRPPGFTMTQRQMIGPSDALNARIEKKFDEMAKSIFQ
jgi:phage gpG-like protein